MVDNNYYKNVVLNYELYNSFFITLPFGGLKSIGNLIPILNEFFTNELTKGKNPELIINAVSYTHLTLPTNREV